MSKEFCQVIISATSEKEAKLISQILIKKKFIAGSLIIKGPSIYWWQDKIVEKIYYNVHAYSLLSKKKEIISEVEKVHQDQVPVISFSKIDGNKSFLEWIKKYVN
jgi:uncharacterized protein involved in tolerance to divalent cations